MSLNHEKLSRASWPISTSIYGIDKNTSEKPIQAYTLIEDGIPEITLDWTAKDDNYSSHKLFI